MREFRIAKGWAIFIWIIAPVMILVFASLLISPFFPSLGMEMSKQAYPFLAPLSLILIAVMVIGLLDAVKGRFVIGDDEVYSISTTGNKRLGFDEIKGYTTNDKYIFIESNNPAKKRIKVSKYFSGTDDIVSWLSSRYPDLDTLTTELEREEILKDEQFGTTTAARAEKLRKAHKTARFLNGIGLLLGAWTLFFPRPYEVAIIASIMVPIVAVAVLKTAKGLIRIDERKGTAYPTVFFAVCVPGVALVLRALWDCNIFSHHNVWYPVALIAVIFIVIVISGNKQLDYKNKATYFTVFGISLMFFAYAYGSVITLNCAFDDSTSREYRATIVDKRISRGKSTTYYFRLSAWGPQKEKEEVKVPKALYNELEEGAEVSVVFKKGRLGIPWFVVRD